MKKIAFFTEFDYPIFNANGSSVYELAKYFSKSENYEVHIMILSDKTFDEDELSETNIYFHHIKKRKKNNKYRIWNNIKRFYNYPYPIHLHDQKDIYKQVEKIIIDNNIENYIAVNNPLVSVIIGKKLKAEKCIQNFCIYNLDDFANPISSLERKYKMFNYFKKYKQNRWRKKLYSASDFIICMEYQKQSYALGEYKDKLYYSDLPFINKLFYSKDIGERFTLLYAGSLDLGFRNPNYLLELILSMDIDVKMEIFSNLNVLDEFPEIKNHKKIHRIISKPYITKEKLLSKVNQTEVLVSIGNKDSHMVPSKIFENISTGKKILHLCSRTNDSSIEYLKKYPNALVLYQEHDIGDNIKKLHDFFYKDRISIEFDKIEQLYPKNTLEYTYNLLNSLIEKNL